MHFDFLMGVVKGCVFCPWRTFSKVGNYEK